MSNMMIVSSARKLVFRPEQGAPQVSFPEGVPVNGYGVNNQTPSVIVRNGTENPATYQGVCHDTGCVILNRVPEDVALAALQIFNEGGRTNAALNAALDYLTAAGCVDQYTTTIEFVENRLSPAGVMLDRHNGVVKRDDRDMTPVWKEGDKIYVHTDAVRDIEPSILLETYRMPDGSEIDLESIPVRVPA